MSMLLLSSYTRIWLDSISKQSRNNGVSTLEDKICGCTTSLLSFFRMDLAKVLSGNILYLYWSQHYCFLLFVLSCCWFFLISRNGFEWLQGQAKTQVKSDRDCFWQCRFIVSLPNLINSRCRIKDINAKYTWHKSFFCLLCKDVAQVFVLSLG